ncbi:MAG: class I SAM-dependent methyltransferase [Myxococcota bacterium]|nr:class I SAM-dependent methyltransferase [Myxococcota bacterium]
MKSSNDDARCLVCGVGGSTLRYQLTHFQILECNECTQIYLDPIPSEESIRKLFAALYTTGEGSLSELRDYYGYCFEDSPDNPLVQQYELWLDAIESVQPPGRLLDVGCGTGLFLSVARRRGWQPFGIDESVEATEHARNHFGLDPWVGEFATFANHGERFDLVTGWDVIEHSRDPVDLLRTARRCLAPGGRVSLSTPNQRSILDLIAGLLYRVSGGKMTTALEKFYIDQHFLYFSPATLRQCLKRADLEVDRFDFEWTDLRRLSVSWPMRLGLEGLFLLGQLLKRQNRLFLITRPAADS